MNKQMVDFRVGTGFDVHKLVENRKCIICGVEIPYEKGLLGHSDADVALHALMDALLGAAALGDIGKHFPDTDDRYKGISSLKLLSYVNDLLEYNGYKVGNIDSIIIAQEPKVKEYTLEMANNIAEVLNVDVNSISVKATTEEGLGFTGNLEGMKAKAVCTLEKF